MSRLLGGENFRCVLFVDGRRREGESCVDRERIFFSFYFSIFYLSLFVVRAKDWKDSRSINFDSVRNFERSEFIFRNYSRFHSFLFVVIQILFF